MDSQRGRWKEEADAALDILQETDPDWDGKYDPEDLLSVAEDWDPTTQLLIDFGNGDIEEVSSTYMGSYLPMATLGRREYYMAADSDEAGQKAVERWRDMADNDKEEFVCMIGEATLIDWARGHSAGPGCVKADSFEDWLDEAVKEHPEEEFASYDGQETEVSISRALAEEADIAIDDGENWVSVVAYRHN